MQHFCIPRSIIMYLQMTVVACICDDLYLNTTIIRFLAMDLVKLVWGSLLLHSLVHTGTYVFYRTALILQTCVITSSMIQIIQHQFSDRI